MIIIWYLILPFTKSHKTQLFVHTPKHMHKSILVMDLWHNSFRLVNAYPYYKVKIKYNSNNIADGKVKKEKVTTPEYDSY